MRRSRKRRQRRPEQKSNPNKSADQPEPHQWRRPPCQAGNPSEQSHIDRDGSNEHGGEPSWHPLFGDRHASIAAEQEAAADDESTTPSYACRGRGATYARADVNDYTREKKTRTCHQKRGDRLDGEENP